MIRFGAKLSARQLVQAPGPGDLLDTIRRRHVDFIEIAWGDDQPFAQLACAGQAVLDAGLGLSVHPYLHAHLAAEIFDPAAPDPGHHRLIEQLSDWADRAPGPVTAVFHGGLARLPPHHRDLPAARAGGRAMFDWYGRRAPANLAILAETQMPILPHDRGPVRLGDTWQSCLDLVGQSRAGVCWDIGHSRLAAARRKHPPTPPQAFLDRLGHVHAHDSFFPVDQILDEIVDHRPLDAGDGQWRVPLALLAAAGYDQRILLEVACEQMPDLSSWLEMLYDGQARTREMFSGPEAQP